MDPVMLVTASGADVLTAFNALLNTAQVCFLAFIAAKYQGRR